MKYLAHISEDGTREQTLDEHLKNTAELAGKFASSFGAESWGRCAGLLHDIGKASDDFQKRLHGGPKTDHSTAGMQRLICQKGLYTYLAPCVAGHHAGMPDWGTPADCSGDSGTVSARMRKKIPDCHLYADKIEIPSLESPKVSRIGKGGLTVSLFIRMIFSCLVDADYLDTENFMQDGCIKRESGKVTAELLDALFSYIDPWLKNTETDTVNGHRTEILKAALNQGKNSPGIYTMTVPTGGGKTVASLAFALQQACTYGLDRIIYVLPYTNIIEQNAQVFRDILGEENVLEHHSNVNYYDSDELHPMQLAAENWDKPVVVTTNVQFFESLYSNRPSKCRKLHNIVKSVIIFDEAQKLPSQYLIPCVKAMEELAVNYGCTILLCTATQPSLQQFFSHGTKVREICPNLEEQFRFFKRTSTEDLGILTEEELTEKLGKQKQALCICNSRKRAQEIYNLLTGNDKEVEGIYHLSTLMYPRHRMRILRTVRERLKEGKECILIATSLVEAGVDIDFQTVYREMAGIDSIVQAAGRCNREGTRPLSESKTYVFTFSERKGTPSELSQPIAAARNVSSRFPDITAQTAVKEYFDQLHHIKGDDLDQKNIIGQLDQQAAAGHFPYRTVAEEFKLIEQDTRSILINTEKQAEELVTRLKYGEHSRQLIREAQQYSVEVFQNDFARLYGVGRLEFLDGDDGQLAVLRDSREDYSETIGLKLDVNLGDAILW